MGYQKRVSQKCCASWFTQWGEGVPVPLVSQF